MSVIELSTTAHARMRWVSGLRVRLTHLDDQSDSWVGMSAERSFIWDLIEDMNEEYESIIWLCWACPKFWIKNMGNMLNKAVRLNGALIEHYFYLSLLRHTTSYHLLMPFPRRYKIRRLQINSRARGTMTGKCGEPIAPPTCLLNQSL